MNGTIQKLFLILLSVSVATAFIAAQSPISTQNILASAQPTLDMSKLTDMVKMQAETWSYESSQGLRTACSYTSQFFLKDDLDINIVFVGIDSSRVNTGTIQNLLPKTYKPINRYPTLYGPENPEYLGIEFKLKYHFKFTSVRFTRDLFSYINSIGVLGSPTQFQESYNSQPGSLVTITENLRIPADQVELWLEKNMYKIGCVEGYTIFFLDGYTKSYLTFHTYFFDEPDFDTNEQFGLRDSRQSIAFGGKYGRVWFYDLSAGPEYWSNNWDPTLYWNVSEQAKPPIWHYQVLKKPAKILSTDIGEITRFIATNLLFTPSTLYRPLLASKIHINVVLFENATDADYYGKDWFSAAIVEQVFEDFEPHKEWKVTFSDRNLMDYPLLNQIFANWAQDENDNASIYFPGYTSYIDFYIYFFSEVDLKTEFLDPAASEWADYTIPVFAYAVTDEQMGVQSGLLGYADDDWTTGIQTFVNAFDTPSTTDLGYGYTATIIHEVGHHVGLSHPHDGYDSELDLDYEPYEYFQFVWTGDEAYTVMGYMSNVGHFSVFDRDTLYRNEAAMYMKAVKQMEKEIIWKNLNRQDWRKIIEALANWNLAMSSFKQMKYFKMVCFALQAYKLMLEVTS
jgi:hypothetical protein